MQSHTYFTKLHIFFKFSNTARNNTFITSFTYITTLYGQTNFTSSIHSTHFSHFYTFFQSYSYSSRSPISDSCTRVSHTGTFIQKLRGPQVVTRISSLNSIPPSPSSPVERAPHSSPCVFAAEVLPSACAGLRKGSTTPVSRSSHVPCTVLKNNIVPHLDRWARTLVSPFALNFR